MNIFGFIYLVRNIVNGKIYVGQTVRRISLRWSSHVSEARRGSRYRLHNAIRKYGADAFTVCEVGCASSQSELDDLEIKYIALMNSIDREVGYNATNGGNSAGTHTVETKKKMSENRRGRRLSDETKARMSASRTGRMVSPETRKKISESKRGKAMSSEQKETLRQINLGKTLPAETREKISKRLIGRVHTEETRRKLRVAKKGKTVSLETRASRTGTYNMRRPDGTESEIHNLSKFCDEMKFNRLSLRKTLDTGVPVAKGRAKGYQILSMTMPEKH